MYCAIYLLHGYNFRWTDEVWEEMSANVSILLLNTGNQVQ